MRDKKVYQLPVDHRIREDQRQEALSLRTPAETRKDKKYPTDHEVILKKMIISKEIGRFNYISGKVAYGRVSQFDRWTITIREYRTDKLRTIFKHALEDFTPVDFDQLSEE